MESAAVLRSFHCGVGTITHVQSLREGPGMLPIYGTTSNKASFSQGLKVCGRPVSSRVNRNGTLLTCVKASETAVAAKSDGEFPHFQLVSSDSSPHGSSEKKILQSTTFPNGFEALVLEVCDETNVTELKLKVGLCSPVLQLVGDFEMHLKRNIKAAKAPTPIISPSTLPPVPIKPMVESAPAAPPTLPPKSISPFKNVSSAKSSKLTALEASGSNAYVLVSSPTVGSFRSGRTVKGKKQPPICKEGDVIKEGQVIGFLDQFGGELPVKSDVAGEVLKLLYSDGDAVGYGDPLVAVLPSFRGIN
ncbi:hypothetical protein HHK36_010638 [Tetracentron sinense]|uniref:Lipoyl-binding domain-containing protein n=1 Tax=Tetracentron sinense TaxID=13715 RepID=A0A834Z9Y6_TETSI|nr:hypothetical protein HHK36_010638 [Tetracentron sinense]